MTLRRMFLGMTWLLSLCFAVTWLWAQDPTKPVETSPGEIKPGETKPSDPPQEEPIDFARARELIQKSRSGEKLTPQCRFGAPNSRNMSRSQIMSPLATSRQCMRPVMPTV